MRGESETASCRTVLISDLHLGSYRSDARSVLDFLARHPTETLYLVGDLIDFWSLRRHAAWQPDHVAVIRRIFELARNGTRVVIIPGNHDGPLLHLAGFGLEGIDVRRQAILQTARGGRFLVAHGHEQDPVFGASNEVVALACGIGERIGELVQGARRRGWLGARAARREHWSDGTASRPATRFESALVEAARRQGADGVICGHSHAPADRVIDGIRYLNCGDWMGHCTAVVEDSTGGMRLVRWGASEAVEAPLGAAEIWIGGDVVAVNQ